jgi:hypothetical protein
MVYSGDSIQDTDGGVLRPISSVHRNRIINGQMVLDQRNAGASVTVSGATIYTVDRWSGTNLTDGAFTVQQDSSAPAGFTNSIKITTTTADSSLVTTQSAQIRQEIEGFNVADLGWGTANAKTVTLSFWVRSSLTGTFGGSLRNDGFTRSYPFSYTISAANTWEQKSITIEGDTSGTWLTTNGAGIRLTFDLGAGPDRSGTAGEWSANNNTAPTGAVSVIGTLSATWYLTGVQLEVGTQATSFEYRQYQQELALCQRYYYRMQAAGANSFFGSGFNESTTVQQTLTVFPVSMRAAPSSLEQSGTAGDYRINNLTVSTACSVVPSFNGADTFSARTQMQVASGLTAGQGSLGRALNSNAYLAWSAEL